MRAQYAKGLGVQIGEFVSRFTGGRRSLLEPASRNETFTDQSKECAFCPRITIRPMCIC